MNSIQLSIDHSLVDDTIFDKYREVLERERSKMEQAIKEQYTTDRASLSLLEDDHLRRHITQATKEKQQLQPSALIVIGIGGSNLGTIALQEAILGKLYNESTNGMKIYYADTVDTDALHDIISIMESLLSQGKEVILNVISKSGTTTETIANAQLLIQTLQQQRTDYQKYVVITTDEESKLWKVAKNEGFTVLPIPAKVGGRFSVFSPVGLFPLGMLGIDIEQLLAGALAMRTQCLGKNVKENPAMIRAVILYHYLKNDVSIHDLFLFCSDCESIGKWYRQLMAESIGKEYTNDNKQVFTGMTPTVSIGSTDLHSMAQLYLGGPYDKLTTFVQVQKHKHDLILPSQSMLTSLVIDIQNKPLAEIMDAIAQGTQRAFSQGERPFMTISLPQKTPDVFGQLLQLFMMEIMYLGYLLNINPFDQPNVEKYKIETKKLLSQSTS